MRTSPIYLAFKRHSCKHLNVFVELSLGESLIARLRGCLGGTRRNLPYRFGAAYAGEGGERIGASALLSRAKKRRFSLSITWFEVRSGPPANFGKLRDLLECVAPSLGEREPLVVASLSYDKDRVESLFRPIQLEGQPTLFDEIAGFKGIKKNAEGKLLYELEVSFTQRSVGHEVTFTQKVRLTEEMPLPLLETAAKISALALRPKEGR